MGRSDAGSSLLLRIEEYPSLVVYFAWFRTSSKTWSPPCSEALNASKLSPTNDDTECPLPFLTHVLLADYVHFQAATFAEYRSFIVDYTSIILRFEAYKLTPFKCCAFYHNCAGIIVRCSLKTSSPIPLLVCFSDHVFATYAHVQSPRYVLPKSFHICRAFKLALGKCCWYQ